MAGLSDVSDLGRRISFSLICLVSLCGLSYTRYTPESRPDQILCQCIDDRGVGLLGLVAAVEQQGGELRPPRVLSRVNSIILGVSPFLVVSYLVRHAPDGDAHAFLLVQARIQQLLISINIITKGKYSRSGSRRMQRPRCRAR